MHPDLHARPLRGLPACLLAGLLLAGCSTTPTYQRPEVSKPDAWRWKVAEPRDQVPRGEWWKVFGDPELDALEAEAAARNQDLQAAMARAEQARALARMSRADLLPSLNGSASWTRYRTSGNAPSPVPFPVPSFTQQQWTTPIDLSYEVDLWGRVRGSFQSARQQALAAEAAQESLRLIIQADVARLYFELQNSQAEVGVLDRTVRLRQEAMEIFEQRFKAGLIGDYELQRGRVEVAAAEAELQAARRRDAQSLNALALVCGRPASGFEPKPSVQTRLPAISADLPSALLERRPDVAQAERELASKLADLGVAKVASYPSLRLTGSGGFLSGELKDLFEWDSRTWGLGPAIAVPLFQGGRNRSNLAKARAAYEEGIARFRQRVLEAFRDVEDSLASLQFLAEESGARGRAAEAARTSAGIALSRYQAGSINFLDVVTAENARLAAELARVRVEHEQRLATVRLIKALGGGWE